MHDDAGDMDLAEFYARVESMIDDLRRTGHVSEADQVESAVRGGATSGEILGRLSLALPTIAVTGQTEAARDLAAWAKDAITTH